ncbi:MAG: T9SS type A sorting domain-containing protein [Melioribacteraceae bacterium]|nr:T9SS type A sorting domain-containing protein [Melioribacteraceae bacterium]
MSGGKLNIDVKVGADANVVSQDTTLVEGNWFVYDDITISEGKTLTIEAGTQITLANGASINVDGTLIAEGTPTDQVSMDFVSSDATNRNGIWISETGTVDMKSTEVQNAWIAFLNYDGTLILDSCDVHDNLRGVYISNAVSASNNCSITDTYLRNNNAEGAFIRRSSPSIINTTISGNSTTGLTAQRYSHFEMKNSSIINNGGDGINTTLYSAPDMGEGQGNHGYNLISGNTSYGFNIQIGVNIRAEGSNTIHANGNNLLTYGNCIMWADQNYWGGSAPDTSAFDLEPTSTFNYQSFLTTAPSAGSSLLKSIKNESLLNLAYKSMYDKEYDKAIKQFEKIIEESDNEKTIILGLNGLTICYDKAKKKGLDKFLKDIIKPQIKNPKGELNKIYLEVFSSALENEGKYNEALSYYLEKKNNFEESDELKKSSLLDEMELYLKSNNREAAEKISKELSKLDLSSQLNAQATLAIYDRKLKKNGSYQNFDAELLKDEVEENIEDYSVGNHPNPFNPTTKINYYLPKAGHVTLKVYNVLGKEVVKLVDEIKTVGKYTATFNASNLASGVYFYTIQVNDFIQTNKMLLLK